MRSITNNKTAMRIAVYLLKEGWEVKQIWSYLMQGRDWRTLQWFITKAIKNHSKFEDYVVSRWSGDVIVHNAEEFKWERELTEDDLMQMPLPYEWRLPIFK